MPIYEYQCEECEHSFEILQKITAEPLQECPECGGAVHKLVSSTSFILKGGGWYATEYGKNRPPKEEKKKAPKPVKKVQKSETKSESSAKTATAA